MKLLTFRDGDDQRLGALTEHGVCDLSASGLDSLRSMQQLIESGSEGLASAQSYLASNEHWLNDQEITWLAPLPTPIQIRDGLGFEEHAINTYENGLKLMAAGAEDPIAAIESLRETRPNSALDTMRKQPIYYKANRFAVCGPDTKIEWPEYSNVMDFELELACIIGQQGKNIPQERAHDYIFGYTIFNDFSARDAQMGEMAGMLGPCKGKDFDNANVLGPVIVTADEIPNPYNLYMRARVNDEVWCDNSSVTMNIRFDDMIAHVSQGETIYPGEVIGSGTVGYGCGLEHGRFLSAGDIVELEIEHIGLLRNQIIRNSQ